MRNDSRTLKDMWEEPSPHCLQWTTFPRDSILGSVWFTSVEASARTSDIRF